MEYDDAEIEGPEEEPDDDEKSDIINDLNYQTYKEEQLNEELEAVHRIARIWNIESLRNLIKVFENDSFIRELIARYRDLAIKRQNEIGNFHMHLWNKYAEELNELTPLSPENNSKKYENISLLLDTLSIVGFPKIIFLLYYIKEIKENPPKKYPERVYTTEEAARILKLNVETVRRYVRQGVIKAVKIGRHWKIKRSELYKLKSKGL